MSRTELIVLFFIGVILHFAIIFPLVGSGALAGAVFCLTWACVSIANKVWVAAKWAFTEGKVVEMTGSDPEVAIFEYNVSGLLLKGRVTGECQIGEAVKVYFDPSVPSRYLSFSRRVEAFDWIMIAMGLAYFVWSELA